MRLHVCIRVRAAVDEVVWMYVADYSRTVPTTAAHEGQTGRKVMHEVGQI